MLYTARAPNSGLARGPFDTKDNQIMAKVTIYHNPH